MHRTVVRPACASQHQPSYSLNHYISISSPMQSGTAHPLTLRNLRLAGPGSVQPPLLPYIPYRRPGQVMDEVVGLEPQRGAGDAGVHASRSARSKPVTFWQVVRYIE